MVVQWNVTIPELTGDRERRAYIYLPVGYNRELQRRYPVLYMFDCHNVFFDKHATYGKSWGMGKYLDRHRKKLIVVAVECNHQGNQRLSEYAPFDFEADFLGEIPGKGKYYMEWMVNTLKPYVDKNYRTLPDRENTLICGSSMGGLMSLYALSAYPSVFQRGACLSPSLWAMPHQSRERILQTDYPKDTCIYMDYGSVELADHTGMEPILLDTVQLLVSKGVNLTFRIVRDGEHNEASWQRQIPVFMEALGL